MEKYRVLEERLKVSEDQLFHKSQALKKLRNQLKVVAELAKSYKTKYEMKEREVSLYKIQLQNLLKTLARTRVELSDEN